MRYTPLLKEYLQITEWPRQIYVFLYVEKTQISKALQKASVVLWRRYLKHILSYIEPLVKQRKTRRYKQYNLYSHSSTVTFLWRRNTVRESSHIFFFCGGDPFCEVVRLPQNTHGGADRFVWVTKGPPPSVLNYRPYIIFSSPMQKYELASSPTYFLFMAGYRNLHTTGVFFFGILLILSANGNICHSIIHKQ